MPGSVRDDTMRQVERLITLLDIAGDMADSLWEGMPGQRHSKVRIEYAIEDAKQAAKAYRVAREKME